MTVPIPTEEIFLILKCYLPRGTYIQGVRFNLVRPMSSQPIIPVSVKYRSYLAQTFLLFSALSPKGQNSDPRSNLRSSETQP